MIRKKILLHICCGPCATFPVISLREQGFEVKGYFFNPNIHPFLEYEKRKQGLAEYAGQTGLEVIYAPEYYPIDYLRQVSYRENQRCLVCYHMRLEQTARIARRGKFDYFTSTLLVSVHQNHRLITELGSEIGKQWGVDFWHQDFRDGFKDTIRISKEMGLYRQQYCGCLYSEWERYGHLSTKKNKDLR